MKIGILVSYIGNFGEKGLYNSQEIGMAKELNRDCNEIIIYKLISNKNNSTVQVEEIKKGITVKYIPVNSVGTHGLVNLNELERNLEILIHFSDIQLIFKKVYTWCRINNVKLIPYVGVIKSNSDNRIKRIITNILGKRNILLYKKCFVLAKTPYVKEQLLEYGIKQVDVLPVGLDTDLLNKDYLITDKKELRKKYNLKNTDNVLLFIGRLDEEKRPIEAIEILNSLNCNNKEFKLILIGKGKLKEKVFNKVREYNLNNKVIYMESIPNNQIWELYHLSDYFINLNANEIFGMAILEAMYYGCRVIAWEAPGPNFIIKNGMSGILCKSIEEIVEGILIQNQYMTDVARTRIIDKFTWKATTRIIERVVKKYG